MRKEKYNKETYELAIKNWIKYNSSKSPQVRKCIADEFNEVKCKALLTFIGKDFDDDDDTETLQSAPNVPFENFWTEYDKKIGHKLKLEKKWLILKDEDRLAIMEYIPRYKVSQPDKQFRKNPETFLNNRTWLDELAGVNLLQIAGYSGRATNGSYII